MSGQTTSLNTVIYIYIDFIIRSAFFAARHSRLFVLFSAFPFRPRMSSTILTNSRITFVAKSLGTQLSSVSQYMPSTYSDITSRPYSCFMWILLCSSHWAQLNTICSAVSSSIIAIDTTWVECPPFPIIN